MVIAFFDPADGPRGALFVTVTNVVWVAVVAWGVTAEIHAGNDGGRVAAVILLAAGATGWMSWLISRVLAYRWLRLPSWLLMAAAGGALSAFAPLALVFVGVAAMAAGMTWPAERAVIVAAGRTSGRPRLSLGRRERVGHCRVGYHQRALGGLTLGIARRQTQERAAQTAKMQVTEARADAEQARAELLAGRNHMARELHDILAHTLSALSLQLEALDARIESGPEPAPEVRTQLDGIRHLVREGLDDARGAVRALREDLPPPRGPAGQVVRRPSRVAQRGGGPAATSARCFTRVCTAWRKKPSPTQPSTRPGLPPRSTWLSSMGRSAWRCATVQAVNLPTVNLPTVNLPTVNLPTANRQRRRSNDQRQTGPLRRRLRPAGDPGACAAARRPG